MFESYLDIYVAYEDKEMQVSLAMVVQRVGQSTSEGGRRVAGCVGCACALCVCVRVRVRVCVYACHQAHSAPLDVCGGCGTVLC